MAKWNNATYEELRSKNSKEAQQIYDDYKESSQESNNTLTGNDKEADKVYENYKENKKGVSQLTGTENEANSLFEKYETSKTDTRLYAYDVYIGDCKLPVTPETINISDGTELKSFKLASGKEIITGVLNLAKEINFECYFPHFTDGELSVMLPYEYLTVLKKYKSEATVVNFQVSETKESLNAIITKLDYSYIPGRDIDYSITLKEVLEVTSNVLEI